MANKTIVVLGGGHAGIEAAFALSRLGCFCKLITMSKKAIGRLSCNPAIGGLAKTHLVKEIDALGGMMGYAADNNALQYKTLNKTKGRAVWSVRAQVDKKTYPLFIQKEIKKDKNIEVVEKEIIDINIKKNKIAGVTLGGGKKISCCAIVVCCGTFSNGLIHIGKKVFPAGRFGEKNTKNIGSFLEGFGHSMIRLKTGTPPRVSLKSINLKHVDVAGGDKNYTPFSLYSNNKKTKQTPCYLVHTNLKTHKIIKKNIKKSAMFSGKISGVGPRYCPSVEDKINRFKDKTSHHLFLEPEWEGSDQIYINGFSTSLPYNTQIQALRSIDALKEVQFIRPGYAIEYDVVPPRQLKSSLESKKIEGLFLAGQINGTSGYEEAAAQGLVAGINAAFYAKNKKPLFFSRSNSYIGVLVDDLITSHLDEPYRMFTSRAEHRLFLRPDNCYTRLGVFALQNKLLTKKQDLKLSSYLGLLKEYRAATKKEKIILNGKKILLSSYLKRPGSFFKKKHIATKSSFYTDRALFEIDTEIKYSGYIQNELDRMDKNKLLDKKKIPLFFDYSLVSGLSNESVERLNKIKPETLGQASRVFGIRPTDITLLGVFLNKAGVSRETKKQRS